MSADASATSEPVVVGIDLGTSAVKVLATTVGGREVASGSEFYGLETPHADEVEQDADDVYRATMRVLREVLSEVRLRGREPAAIGFSSAMHGVLCVDDAGSSTTDGNAVQIWGCDGTDAQDWTIGTDGTIPEQAITAYNQTHPNRPY